MITAMISFTPAGYAALSTRKLELLQKREEVVVRLQQAREMGDLSENGAYKAARFELSDTDRELRRLEYLLKEGKAVEPRTDGTVGMGNTVTVENQDGKQFTYMVVGTYEADPLRGTISVESPMGKELDGKRVKDAVEVNGNRFTVVEVA